MNTVIDALKENEKKVVKPMIKSRIFCNLQSKSFNIVCDTFILLKKYNLKTLNGSGILNVDLAYNRKQRI